MKKSRRTYNGVHLNKKSNTQDVVEQSLTLKPHFSNVNGTFALHLNTFSFVIIWKDLSLRIIKYRLVGFYCSLV